jgi:serine/threonine protein phosphatase PrpC
MTMAGATRSPIQLSGESEQFQRYRLDCAALSAAGRGRAINEDYCLFAGPGSEDAERAAAGYIFAAIDGNAHGGRGRSAARETATSLLEIFDDDRRTVLRPDLLSLRLHDANDRIAKFIKGRCAVTALWIWEDPGQVGMQAAWAHVGDTRLYLQNPKGWRQVTRDHAKGRLLDRAIGEGAGLRIDTGKLTLMPGERLALLTDGTWNSAPPSSVFSAVKFPATAQAVRLLVGNARLNGGVNDTTAIVITARNVDEGPEPEH